MDLSFLFVQDDLTLPFDLLTLGIQEIHLDQEDPMKIKTIQTLTSSTYLLSLLERHYLQEALMLQASQDYPIHKH